MSSKDHTTSHMTKVNNKTTKGNKTLSDSVLQVLQETIALAEGPKLQVGADHPANPAAIMIKQDGATFVGHDTVQDQPAPLAIVDKIAHKVVGFKSIALEEGNDSKAILLKANPAPDKKVGAAVLHKAGGMEHPNEGPGTQLNPRCVLNDNDHGSGNLKCSETRESLSCNPNAISVIGETTDGNVTAKADHKSLVGNQPSAIHKTHFDGTTNAVIYPMFVYPDGAKTGTLEVIVIVIPLLGCVNASECDKTAALCTGACPCSLVMTD